MEDWKSEQLAAVCEGLSEVCTMLSEQKQGDEVVMNEKIKIMKRHNPDDMNLEVIKTLMKKKKEDHKKYAISFKKKAKIFKEFAKLHKVNSKEVKDGKKTRKNKV